MKRFLAVLFSVLFVCMIFPVSKTQAERCTSNTWKTVATSLPPLLTSLPEMHLQEWEQKPDSITAAAMSSFLSDGARHFPL